MRLFAYFVMLVFICVDAVFACDSCMTLSNYAGKKYEYNVTWEYIRSDASGDVTTNINSESETVLYFDNDHYLIYSSSDLKNDIFASSEILIYFTPDHYYLYQYAIAHDGAIVLPVLQKFGHEYDCFYEFSENEGLAGFLLADHKRGMYDPFRDGLYNTFINSVLHKDGVAFSEGDESNYPFIIESSANFVDAAFERSNKELANTVFVVEVDQGSIIRNYRIGGDVMLDYEKGYFVRNVESFSVTDFNDGGMLPIKGLYIHQFDHHLVESGLFVETIRILEWSDMNVSNVADVESLYNEILDRLNVTEILDHSNS